MDLSPLHDPLPEVLARRQHKVSRFFTVEELDLRFHNGKEMTYEKLVGGNGAVLGVPFDGTHFILSSEYACGFERYELGFVKGKIDRGETPEQAMARELEEEIGYKPAALFKLRDEMPLAPGMMQLRMHCYLCTNLSKMILPTGDEPEPIGTVKVTPEEAKELLFAVDSPLKEARSVACLALAMHQLEFL